MMNRWGSGSGCAERIPDSAAAKEAQAKVAAMVQERARQDAELWGPQTGPQTDPQTQDPLKKPASK